MCAYALKSINPSLICPILEYASVVCSPCYEIHTERIDLPSYNDRCNLIHLDSLHRWKFHFSIFVMFDLLNDRIQPKLFSLLLFNEQSRSLGSPDLFRLPKHRTNYSHFEQLIICRVTSMVFKIFTCLSIYFVKYVKNVQFFYLFD